jgi:hypothetical protein
MELIELLFLTEVKFTKQLDELEQLWICHPHRWFNSLFGVEKMVKLLTRYAEQEQKWQSTQMQSIASSTYYV